MLIPSRSLLRRLFVVFLTGLLGHLKQYLPYLPSLAVYVILAAFGYGNVLVLFLVLILGGLFSDYLEDRAGVTESEPTISHGDLTAVPVLLRAAGTRQAVLAVAASAVLVMQIDDTKNKQLPVATISDESALLLVAGSLTTWQDSGG